MRNLKIIILALIGSTFTVWGQASHALFISNQGQWPGNFNHKLRLNSGAVFFENNGYTIALNNASEFRHEHDEADLKTKHEPLLKEHVIKVKFLFANLFTDISESAGCSFYHNYFLGNDPKRWRSKVPVSRELNYYNLYPGIDVRFKGKGGNLKYDLYLAPGADPRLLQMQYSGAEQLSIQGRQLLIQTSLGPLKEFIPEAYQIIDGVKKTVPCSYQLQGSIVKFNLGAYDASHALVIDPELVFSSFSGSSSDNWGFTATYDKDGNMYGGGVAFNDGGTYPTTAGAFQSTPQGGLRDVDIAISKFSAIGDALLFSTYIGGNLNDLPHSLVVNDQNQLYILGNTGSNDFPVSPQAYQPVFAGGPQVKLRAFAFNQGSDIYVSKLSADGTAMLGSTFLGGPEADGVNTGIVRNYGDNSRGEIIYTDSKVYIISQSSSPGIVLNNSFQDSLTGKQDALIACFSDDLSNLIWGTYYGGTEDDAGYSIKADQTDQVVIAGGTYSDDIQTLPGGHTTISQGNADGYVALFNRNTGSFNGATYIGTAGLDQVFLLDIDKNNNLYAFGQTNGSMSVSAGIYGNPNSRQFIKKFNSNLTQELWSTTIGSGLPKSDIVPTAFLVDDCFNIYLSGWNGESNKLSNGGIPQGNTQSLPLTNDAEQSTTDGSDFYFMVLGRNARSLVYASYFGGTSFEHVDGGTSRFDPNGTIYQAVCAGCSQESFPTTPGVVAETNGSPNCNLGVLKLDFETSVQARPEIDFTVDTDTICDTLFVSLSNSSINAQLFEWDFGNGRTSTEAEPLTFYDTLGTYTIKLVAIDTNCAISDTSFITLVHDSGTFIKPYFTSDYVGCDSRFKASFTNISEGAQAYQWSFGDGDISQLAEPVHEYPDTGTYVVSLTAINTHCKTSETFTDTLVFRDTTIVPQPMADISLCSDGSLDISLKDDRKRYDYTWDFGNGEIIETRHPNYRYQQPGIYTVKVTIEDSICNNRYSLEYPIVIQEIISEVFIPNAFSPNGDGINETLEIFGNQCDGSSEIHIFNRWGEEVFYSQDPFNEFWDAFHKGKPAPMGIYTYKLRYGKQYYRGSITLIR